jgi:hypothetical protein
MYERMTGFLATAIVYNSVRIGDAAADTGMEFSGEFSEDERSEAKCHSLSVKPQVQVQRSLWRRSSTSFISEIRGTTYQPYLFLKYVAQRMRMMDQHNIRVFILLEVVDNGKSPIPCEQRAACWSTVAIRCGNSYTST